MRDFPERERKKLQHYVARGREKIHIKYLPFNMGGKEKRRNANLRPR